MVPSPRRSTLMSRLRKSIGLKGVCITLSNGDTPGAVLLAPIKEAEPAIGKETMAKSAPRTRRAAEVGGCGLNGRSHGPVFRQSPPQHKGETDGFRILGPHQGAGREAQQVHGRGHLSGRARLRRADGEGQGPLAAPQGDRRVQGRSQEARPLEHVPAGRPRLRRHARHDGSLQPRIRADLRSAGPLRRSPPRRSTARRPTPATWKCSPATAPRSTRRSG